MIVDGKVRKMKFSERVRENFERFKDRIEGLGRKALIGGILIGGSVGCASNGNTTTTSTTSYYRYEQVLRGEITFDDYINNADPYDFCYTKEDTITQVALYWWKLTGSRDPLVWERLIMGDSTALNECNMDSVRFRIKDVRAFFGLYIDTQPYIDTIIERTKNGRSIISK